MEEYICEFCGKVLSEEKGELAHGCLTCHGMPYTYTINALVKENKELRGYIIDIYTEAEYWRNKKCYIKQQLKEKIAKAVDKIKPLG